MRPGPIDPEGIEVIDDATAEALRRMGGTRRLAMLDELVRFARDIMASGVRSRHPEWSREQIEREVARMTAAGLL